MTHENHRFIDIHGHGVLPFVLRGGLYQITLAAQTWGSVALEAQAADRLTYVPFETWHGNRAMTIRLGCGAYQFVYSGLDGGAVSVSRIG